MQLSQQCLELLADMFDCSAMEKDEVEHFGTFADIFVPLSQSTTCCLSLH